MSKKQEDQNYCPVCGQPDNCGDCTHSPNVYNPQDPLTAAAVIAKLNEEMYGALGALEQAEIKLERKEEYVQNLQAQLRSAREACVVKDNELARSEKDRDHYRSRLYDDDGFAYADKVEGLRDELARANGRLRNQAFSITELQEQVDKEKSYTDALRTKLQRQYEKVESLKDKVETLNLALVGVEQQNAELLANPPVILDSAATGIITDLQQEKDRLHHAIEQWKVAVREKDARIADLKEIQRAKDDRIGSLENSNNILRGTIRDARTALSAN